MNISVLKFGGTSVKNIGRIQHVCDIISKTSGKRLVVVSAMGDTTDHLVKLAKQCAAVPDDRELDMLLATGEQISIALLAITLRRAGVSARSFTGAQVNIITDKTHSSARILDIDRSRLLKEFEQNDVIIVAGFQGVTSDGEITTLGRGGSDTSAVALAAAVGATTCKIYTDVDGVYSADPNRISNAKLVSQISYSEVLELAYAGAQVIHPRAVELAREHKVALQVRNTFKPDHPGTLIHEGGKMEKQSRFSGVAIDRQVAVLRIEGTCNSKVLDIVAKLFQRERVTADSISHVDSKIDVAVCCVIKYSDVDAFVSAIEKLRIAHTRGRINVDLDVAKVSLVGKGLAADQLLLPKVLACLEEECIEVTNVVNSDIRISCLVPHEDAARAAQILHERFASACDISNDQLACLIA